MKCAQIMPLSLSVLSTVPVRLSVRNSSCLLHIFFTLFITPPQNVWAMMDSLCRVRPSVGRSVRPSVLLHYRVRSIYRIPIDGFSSNLAAMLTSSRGCAEPMLPLCQLNVKGPYSQRIILGSDLDFDLNSDLDFPESIFKTVFTNGFRLRLSLDYLCRRFKRPLRCLVTLTGARSSALVVSRWKTWQLVTLRHRPGANLLRSALWI